ncbi:MAG: AHH domain-containing protein [Cystobacter sp.]
MILRVISVLCLLLMPFSVQATPSVDARPSMLKTAWVSAHHDETGEGLKLTFEPLEWDPVLASFTQEDAREVRTALEEHFRRGRRWSALHPLSVLPMSVLTASQGAGTIPEPGLLDLERRVREEDESLYGYSLLPLPASMERTRWFQALMRAPLYMGDGVRQAAMELLSSPVVALSLGMSMMLYMVAWAAPEPLFSKAFAAAVTLGLLMTYTAAELHNVGRACLALYREAEAARTQEQLDAVAERFGRALGAVGLRVLVTIAGAKLASGLPSVPQGGLWSRLSPPRFAFAGGRGSFTVGTGARAQVYVANGTVVLMGVAANTAASAVASARTTGACAESKRDNNHAHHLCTNKNDRSESNGGPWTPLFEGLFNQAGMSLEDPANIVYLRAHQGPHLKDYHSEVFKRLRDALKGCRTRSVCRTKLVKALDEIAGEVCSQGSVLNKLVTRAP